MKPAMIAVLIFVAAGLLLLGCQPTMPASSLAADIPSPAPVSGSAIAGAATATPAPPPSPRPSPTPEATSIEGTPLTPTVVPVGWRSYTTELGVSFACPADWRVDLPGARDGTSGPLILRLYAPAGQYAGGNQFSFFYIGYPIGPGQSLESWSQQVFLASQGGMIPPRAILSAEKLPPAEPEDQTLLVTELAGPDPGWHVHHLYLAHGRAVLQLKIQTVPEQSPLTQQALRALAATIRFTPDAGERALRYGAQQGMSLSEFAATATAVASITPEPRCDLVCRDATAAASITPGPIRTYPPAFATQEAQYYSMMATREAEARKVTPTPSPSVTPSPTPKPADQPGWVLYEGKSREGPVSTPQPFQLAYDPSWWQRNQEGSYDYLAHRQLPSCQLWINPGGQGVGGPLVAEQIHLAGLDWEVYYYISDGLVSYHPKRQDIGLWFRLEMGSWAPAGVVQPCRKAAEEVLNTLRIQ